MTAAKKIIFLVSCVNIFFSFNVLSQRRDNIWMLGAACISNFYSLPTITFNSGIVDTFSTTRNLGFFITNSSICDTAGNLLFYTNGVKIRNAVHDTLFNSTNYNPGYESTSNCVFNNLHFQFSSL